LTIDSRFAGTRLELIRSGIIKNINTENFSPGAVCRGLIRGMIKELTDMVDRRSLKQFRNIMVSGNGVRKNPLAMEFIREELGLSCLTSSNRTENGAKSFKT
jgi:hypothetical protein